MWVKVDENFPEHPKVLRAGEALGANGCARVAAVWLEALCYANRNLTDGFISNAVARRFHFDRDPLQVLRVLSSKQVRLFRKVPAGFQIHNYDQYQFSKAEIEEKRRKERDRKKLVRADVTRIPRGVQRSDPIRSDPIRSDPIRPDPIQPQKSTGTRARAASVPGLIDGADQRRHGLHAWCDHQRAMCVPFGLHGQFKARLGGPDADVRLRAWYPTVIAAYEGREIGDRLFEFWDNAFAAWVGTVTAAPSSAPPSKSMRAVEAFAAAGDRLEVSDADRTPAAPGRIDLAGRRTSSGRG